MIMLLKLKDPITKTHLRLVESHCQAQVRPLWDNVTWQTKVLAISGQISVSAHFLAYLVGKHKAFEDWKKFVTRSKVPVDFSLVSSREDWNTVFRSRNHILSRLESSITVFGDTGTRWC